MCNLAPRPGRISLGLPTTLTRIANPPAELDACCTNASSITFPLAPDPRRSDSLARIAKYKQDLQYASAEWHAVFSTLRNTIEGFNGFAKSDTEEALEAAGRRRVRGYAWQAVLVAVMITASNIRKIKKFIRNNCEATAPPPKPNAKPDGRAGTNLAVYRPDPNAPPLARPA